ncbi:CheR family methyltransferase [Balneatrix alpica]|uniref:Chemotaxis protein methyltransferase n=1 Tax=Balneatrix alpica TaxID=75684 RepID=A0ABV5ZHF1_9GAMM|nr:protein-glutamate O-methyltransferase CheR [Balneatrix alpica]
MAITPEARATGQREFLLTGEDFTRICELVYQLSGIVLGEAKREMVYSRLARRLRQLELRSFSEYIALLEDETGQERIAFINALTTNLTAFFRESHHFDYVVTQVIPLLKARTGPKRVRMWSAACSTGEEAYSLAMVLAEHFDSSWDVKVLATDLDSNVVAAAKQGSYPLARLEQLPGWARKRWVTIEGDHLSIRPEVRQLVTFKQLNLLGAWPMRGPFDVVFCRNVVIYFDRPTQATLFSRIADMLAPQGTLFIGHSETLNQVSSRFISQGNTIYTRAS